MSYMGKKEFQVPKRIILTFMENAIKHDLRHKESEKMDIEVVKVEGGLKISIRNNEPARMLVENYIT